MKQIICNIDGLNIKKGEKYLVVDEDKMKIYIDGSIPFNHIEIINNIGEHELLTYGCDHYEFCETTEEDKIVILNTYPEDGNICKFDKKWLEDKVRSYFEMELEDFMEDYTWDDTETLRFFYNNITWELCPQCDEEVVLENKFERQICPNCGEPILPCSICETMDCRNCPLEKWRTTIGNTYNLKCNTCNEIFEYTELYDDEEHPDDYFIECPGCKNTEGVGNNHPQNFQRV